MENQMNDIDSVIAEAFEPSTEAPKVDSVEEPKANDEPEDFENQDDQKEGDADEDGDNDDNGDDLPKHIKKSLDKNRRYIRNLREREKALIAELEKLKTEKIEPKQLKEEEFEGSYGEFIKQQALEEMKAMMGQNHHQQKIDMLTQQQQALMAEKAQTVQMEAVEFAKQSEDFAKVVPASAQEFDALSAEMQSMFFELENPTLAAYALAKEGKIEQLAYMSPYMAAVEIRQAEARGQQYLNQSSKKAVSNAPAPIQGAKGSSKPPPSRLGEKSPDELYKWITS